MSLFAQGVGRNVHHFISGTTENVAGSPPYTFLESSICPSHWDSTQNARRCLRKIDSIKMRENKPPVPIHPPLLLRPYPEGSIPVVTGVPDGPVWAQLVTLQLVEGMLPVGVLARLQQLG